MNLSQNENQNEGEGPRNAVVLVVDGLSAAMLGAYGNTWFETANSNRLAARSLLFDYAFSSSTNLEHSYQRFWMPAQPSGSDSSGSKNLIETIANSGASTNLLTDEAQVGESSLASSFDHVTQIAPARANKIADSVAETELANFFARATSWLFDLEPGSLAWIHSRGLTGAWDAPHQMRASLMGEGDPVPGDFYQPPSGMFDLEQDDPDDLLAFQQACAAQVMMLDQFLGVLLDLMESDPVWRSALICFTSPRGYALGEHGVLGHGNELPSNYNESVHVPLMVSVPDTPQHHQLRDFQSVRNGSLRQTDLIGDCLLDWFTNDLFADRFRSLAFEIPKPQNQAVVIDSQKGSIDSQKGSIDSQRDSIESDGMARSTMSIQTQAWKLIKKTGEHDLQNSHQVELYAKPDDRWEVNDVSRRCPHIVEALTQVLDDHIKAGGLGRQGCLDLEESLWHRAK